MLRYDQIIKKLFQRQTRNVTVCNKGPQRHLELTFTSAWTLIMGIEPEFCSDIGSYFALLFCDINMNFTSLVVTELFFDSRCGTLPPTDKIYDLPSYEV